MAEGLAYRRPTNPWPVLAADRNGLASWDASMSPARRKVVGSAEQSHQQPNSAHTFLRSRRSDDPAAWLYQEDTENTTVRATHCSHASEGVEALSANPHIGSTLDDFLKEEGLFEDATNHAVKRVLAWQVEQAMQQQGITKTEMARRMGTSRAHLDRLLDPENDKVQLDTVHRAAAAIGRKVRLVLV